VVPPIFLIQVFAGLVVSDAAWELVSRALSGFGASSLRSVAQAAISVLKAATWVYCRRVVNFAALAFRNRPKGVGRACGAALWTTETVLLGPFWHPHNA
jgi:hypothetical protein